MVHCLSLFTLVSLLCSFKNLRVGAGGYEVVIPDSRQVPNCPCHIVSRGPLCGCRALLYTNEYDEGGNVTSREARVGGLVSRTDSLMFAQKVFVIPQRTTHTSHWLEELAHYCNAVVVTRSTNSKKTYSNYSSFLARLHAVEDQGITYTDHLVVIDQVFETLANIMDMDSLTNLVLRPLSSMKTSWVDIVSSALTFSSILQTATALEIAVFSSKEKSRKRSLLFTLNNNRTGFIPFDKWGRLVQQHAHTFGEVVYVRHHSVEFNNNGHKYFSSRQSCEIMRRAMRVISDMYPSIPTTQHQGNSSSDAALFRVTVINRKPPPKPQNGNSRAFKMYARYHKTRLLHEVPRLIEAIQSHFENKTEGKRVEVSEFTLETNQQTSVASQIALFATSDVIIAPHGASFYAIPAMRENALVVEAFGDMARGSCLSSLLGLGLHCGVTHRVLNPRVNNKHSFNHENGNLCDGDISFGGETNNVELVLGMIHEWQERTKNGSFAHSESYVMTHYVDGTFIPLYESNSCEKGTAPGLGRMVNFEYEYNHHCLAMTETGNSSERL